MVDLRPQSGNKATFTKPRARARVKGREWFVLSALVMIALLAFMAPSMVQESIAKPPATQDPAKLAPMVLPDLPSLPDLPEPSIVETKQPIVDLAQERPEKIPELLVSGADASAFAWWFAQFPLDQSAPPVPQRFSDDDIAQGGCAQERH